MSLEKLNRIIDKIYKYIKSQTEDARLEINYNQNESIDEEPTILYANNRIFIEPELKNKEKFDFNFVISVFLTPPNNYYINDPNWYYIIRMELLDEYSDFNQFSQMKEYIQTVIQKLPVKIKAKISQTALISQNYSKKEHKLIANFIIESEMKNLKKISNCQWMIEPFGNMNVPFIVFLAS